MVDTLNPAARSHLMKQVKGKNTKPELIVRRLLREIGIGYRLHRGDLPGRPDIAFIGRKKAIFVHGCFWHAHDPHRCRKGRAPSTHTDYWDEKRAANRARDARKERELLALGYDVLTIWECELKNTDALRESLAHFFVPGPG